MTQFKTEAEMASWLKAQEEVYEQYANRLWREGIRSVSILATANQEDLCKLEIPHMHANNIIKRAAAAPPPSSSSSQPSQSQSPSPAMMCMYAVKKKGMRKRVRFQAPASATLDELKKAIRKALPTLKKPDFTVWHDKVEVTTDLALHRLVTCTPVAEPVALFARSSAVAFSSNVLGTLKDLLEEQLYVMSYNGIPNECTNLIGQLSIEPPAHITHCQGGGKQTVTFTELIDVIVNLFIFRLEAMGGFCESDMNQQDFIDAIMVASVLVARELFEGKDPDGRVLLRREGASIGRYALGNLDWVVVYRTLAVLVMQAKNGEDTVKGWARLYRGIRAMRDNLEAAAGGRTGSKKRKAIEAFDLPQMPSYAVLCNARQWHIVKYMPASDGRQAASIQQSTLTVRIHRSSTHDRLKADITSCVLALAGLLIEQMTALDRAIDYNPGLLSAGALTSDEMKDVEVAEAEAALEAAAGSDWEWEETDGEWEETEEEEEETEEDQETDDNA